MAAYAVQATAVDDLGPVTRPRTPLGDRPSHALRHQFGNIDIYLFDQLLKGRLVPGTRLLDAGCGDGRNLVYFLRGDYDVYAVDRSSSAITEAQELAYTTAPETAIKHFRVERVESLSFEDAWFDAVLGIAVLHFAENESHFRTMLREMWRVLKQGGFFFARLASTIGFEDRAEPLGDRRYRLPDGTERFLVDEGMLLKMSRDLGGELLEPLKTVNVQNERCMTTWCLRKTG